MRTLGDDNKDSNYPDILLMAKGSHQFSKFQLNIEMKG